MAYKEYTLEAKQEILEKVITRMIDGESLRKIVLSPDMPDRITLLRWLNDENSEHATIIARTRELQADGLHDDIGEICRKIESGELDANAGKAIIWAKQWSASKLRPKRYGERLDLGNADGQAFNITIAK